MPQLKMNQEELDKFARETRDDYQAMWSASDQCFIVDVTVKVVDYQAKLDHARGLLKKERDAVDRHTANSGTYAALINQIKRDAHKAGVTIQ